MKNFLGLLTLVFAFSAPTFAVDSTQAPPAEEEEGETEVEPNDWPCGENSGWEDVGSDEESGDTEITGDETYDTTEDAINAGEGTLAEHVVGTCSVCPPVANGDRCSSFATTRGGAATYSSEAVVVDGVVKYKSVVTVPDGAAVLAGCVPC